MLKHLLKLRRYMLFGDEVAHHQITYNDIISANVLTYIYFS